MTPPTDNLYKRLLVEALSWFGDQFGKQLSSPLSAHFASVSLPRQVFTISMVTHNLVEAIRRWPVDPLSPARVGELLAGCDPAWGPVFKQGVLLYRRYSAAEAERNVEKTIHPELIETLERDTKLLDAIVGESWFQSIASLRLPRLSDFLPSNSWKHRRPIASC